MVLYLIGLGLCDEKKITLRGLEYIKSSDYIYMEYYTSILSVDKSKLGSLYEKQIILAEIYESSKFIRVNEGLNELIETSEKCEKEEYRSVIGLESLWFDLSRIGSETQVIKCWKIKDVLHMDFGMTFYFNLWENPF